MIDEVAVDRVHPIPFRTVALVTAIAMAVTFLLSLPFFAGPLHPWPDQAWTLQAAMRYSAGLGLTSSLDSGTNDITAVEYKHLSYFPPLYPLLVAWLLEGGMSVATAVKLANLLALIIGVLLWIRLASRYLPLSWLVLFAALLAPVCGGIVPTGGTTDYVFWAVVPLWVESMERGIRSPRLRWLVLAAVLVATLIGFRWAAAFLVPAGTAAICFARRNDIRRLVVDAFIYGSIPTAFFIALSLVNHSLSGRGTVLAYTPQTWNLHLLATPYPFEALVTIPLGAQAVLLRVLRAIGRPGAALSASILYGLPILLMAIILFLPRKTTKGELALLRIVSIWIVSICTVITLLALLLFMTARYAWEGTNWSYLGEPRYYRPLLPLMALLWLTFLERLRDPWRRTMWVCLACISLYVLQGAARITASQIRNPDESLLLTRKVLSLRELPGRKVVFDISIDEYLLDATADFIPRTIPPPEGVSRLLSSRSADVWVVHRVGYQEAYAMTIDWPEQKFAALSSVLHPGRVWTSPTGRYELYRTHVGRGPLGGSFLENGDRETGTISDE